MLSFFQPATDRIIGLIKQQVADAKLRASDCPIKTIVLVGGFGDSNFLFGEIEKWCQLNGDISLICPPKPSVLRIEVMTPLAKLQQASGNCQGCRFTWPTDCDSHLSKMSASLRVRLQYAVSRWSRPRSGSSLLRMEWREEMQ